MASAALAFTEQALLEPGDRFEVQVSADRSMIRLPAGFPGREELLGHLEGESGARLTAQFEEEHVLRIAGLSALLPQRFEALWLEYAAAGRWRLIIEPVADAASATEVSTEHRLRIELDANDVLRLADGSRRECTLAEFDVAMRAAQLSRHAGFDQLICLPLVRDMELLEHQIRTAKTVLRRLRGRALLCDEVGLGKTIEAGLVFDELSLRGLARSVLVLVPPSLIEQWQGEMRRKFSLELISHDDPAFRQEGALGWSKFDRVIASMHTAKREPHRSAILARQWDLVIVDEAHHLRNRSTQLWKFASEIQKQFILLLTATPVQNNLDELFNLVTLLEPGLLSTAKQFQKQFVDRKDKLAPSNVDELHRRLGEVMVRNRRSTVGLQFTRRWARTERVAMGPEEQALYRAVADFVRSRLAASKSSGALARMGLLSLQMALGSSAQAAAGTLTRLAAHENLEDEDRARLAELAWQAELQTENAKVTRLLAILREFEDKMVIFTQFRATQEMLVERLRRSGESVSVFHGGLSRLEKEAAIERFRGPDRLLLCTESGSEGRNLQFAHAVCNFDLPWNPMKIEQRIGRLSRIGQTHDVHVFNLVAAGTVEDAVLHLLEAKLNLFELVIGEIDMILGNLDEERDFQDVVADEWTAAADVDDFGKRMEELGNRLVAAKEAYLAQKSADEKLFANRFAPDQ